ncbi:hypothetical protein ABZ930_12725 [Streptomyces sp. NPDC046716]|uniref:hypothetical protein n=1 Tax=Streptomyces sp. NPDC046716 TaxID=3157093 RepID=UPI0033E06F3E
MNHLRPPRRPGHRRSTATASVLLLPLTVTALAACSDAGDTAAPPVASPAATASGERCATKPIVPETDAADAAGQSAATGVYTLDKGAVKAPRKQTFTARRADRSAILVSGSGRLSTYDSKVTKNGGASSLAAAGGHGVNAGVLARDGGRLDLSGGLYYTTGKGSSGVAATGEDTRATLSGGGINTQGASSDGVFASYGGVLDLTYVQIVTMGAQSAPVATGPGGGKVTVSGGTMTSAGCGSPGVHTSGDVSLSGTLFDLANSEAFTVEAGGSLALKNVRATAAAGGVVLRGDGKTSYTMEDGALLATDGDVFSVRGGAAEVELSGGAEVKTKSGALLRVKGMSDATFRADDEKLTGDVVVADGSTADLELTGSTKLDGKVKGASLTLSDRARWSVAGPSTLSGLSFGGGSGSDGSGSDGVAKKVAKMIDGHGYAVTYDEASSPQLDGKSYRLKGGGTLKPA